MGDSEWASGGVGEGGKEEVNEIWMGECCSLATANEIFNNPFLSFLAVAHKHCHGCCCYLKHKCKEGEGKQRDALSAQWI